MPLSVGHTMKWEFIVVGRSMGEISLKKVLSVLWFTRVCRFFNQLLFLFREQTKVNFLLTEIKPVLFVIRFARAE